MGSCPFRRDVERGGGKLSITTRERGIDFFWNVFVMSRAFEMPQEIADEYSFKS